MSLLAVLRTSGSALTAQRLRMDIIAHNVANSETTRTPEGGPYRRQQVVFAPRLRPPADFLTLLRRGDVAALAQPARLAEGVEVVAVLPDLSPPRLVYNPTHPDANAEGYVAYPNVNLVTELTDMLSATRSYEANLTVIQAAKAMAQRALDLARG